MTKLEGRVALVTGGARGLGAAAARALAGEGAKVVVSDIGDGTETASAVGGTYIKHDVTSEADWVATIDFTKTTFGGLDILVNNAGIFWVRPISMTTLEAFRQMQQVNVEGVFLGLKHGIPAIAERAQKWDGGGSIVWPPAIGMPARAQTDSPPSSIFRITPSGIWLTGMPTSASANSGTPPIA